MILSAQFHAHALELYKNIASYDKKNSGLEVCLSKKKIDLLFPEESFSDLCLIFAYIVFS